MKSTSLSLISDLIYEKMWNEEISLYCNTIQRSRLPCSVEQCHDCAAPDMLSVKYNTRDQSFCKTLLPLHLKNKNENTYWHFILFFMKNDHWRKWQQIWICAGRYFSYFSWLHEEMTYCQKNPITLILKSNICFIKPNPYLADFLRNSKSFSHCEMLYFISNMCGSRFCRQNNKLSVWIWIPAEFADNQYEISVYRTEPIFEELTTMKWNQQLIRKLL